MPLSQYIPAGSEIVIARNGQHEWYTTKKDVPIETTESQDCPVRGVPVLTTVHQGFRIWFLDGQIRVNLSEAQLQHARNLRLVTLEYDIPTRVENQLVHPSTYLWNYGVRSTKSCWLVPKGQLPLVRLRDLTRTGCNWKYKPVDPEAVAESMSEAVAGLQGERQRAIAAHKKGLENAQKRYNDNPDNLPVHTLQIRLRNDRERIEKTLKKCLDDVKTGARALGIPIEWTEQTSLVVRRADAKATPMNVNAAFNSAARKEADDAGKVHDRALALGTAEGREVAKAVASNTMPADIAKDYVEEKESENAEYSLVDENGDVVE